MKTHFMLLDSDLRDRLEVLLGKRAVRHPEQALKILLEELRRNNEIVSKSRERLKRKFPSEIGLEK